jgi:hypothetical protein
MARKEGDERISGMVDYDRPFVPSLGAPSARNRRDTQSQLPRLADRMHCDDKWRKNTGKAGLREAVGSWSGRGCQRRLRQNSAHSNERLALCVRVIDWIQMAPVTTPNPRRQLCPIPSIREQDDQRGLGPSRMRSCPEAIA